MRIARPGRLPSAERDRVPPNEQFKFASLLSARQADIGLFTKGALMPSRNLPPRPNLAQLKRQANELHKLQREKKLSDSCS